MWPLCIMFWIRHLKIRHSIQRNKYAGKRKLYISCKLLLIYVYNLFSVLEDPHASVLDAIYANNLTLTYNRDQYFFSHRKNLGITADSSAVFDLILWIQSLEFQTQCLAVVNCLIFCDFLLLATSACLQFTVKCCHFRGHILVAKNGLPLSFLPTFCLLTWYIWRVSTNYMTGVDDKKQ